MVRKRYSTFCHFSANDNINSRSTDLEKAKRKLGDALVQEENGKNEEAIRLYIEVTEFCLEKVIEKIKILFAE